eukprot:gene8238-10126_t
MEVDFVEVLNGVGSVFSQDPSCHLWAGSAAQLDEYGPSTGGDAISFNDPNIPLGHTALNFRNVSYIAANDGVWVITGTLYANSDPNGRYSMHWVFRRSSDSFTAKRELQERAYAPNGPVDTSTFQYYRIDPTDSYLIGSGSAQGIVVNITEFQGMPLQTGVGANGKNIRLGASGWFAFSFSRDGSVIYQSGEGIVVDINIDITCLDCPTDVFRASAAEANADLGGQRGGQAISIQSSDLSPFGGNDRFNFVSDSGRYTIAANGDVTISGTLAPVGSSDGSNQMQCSFLFHPSANGMPKLELSPSAYAPGGPIDPNYWTFYRVDTSTATGCSINGNAISITGDFDMFLQVGVGANGKNGNLGAAVWLSYYATMADGRNVSVDGSVLDINIDLECIPTQTGTPCPTDTPSPTPSTSTTSTTGEPSTTSSTTGEPTTTGSTTDSTTSSTTGEPTTTGSTTDSTTSSTTGEPSTTSTTSTTGEPSTTSTSTTTSETPTPTQTSPTPSPTVSPTSTPTPSPNCTWTCVPNETPTPTPTQTQTPTPTPTQTTAPVGGNSAGTIEISKILVSGLSLLASLLVFVH